MNTFNEPGNFSDMAKNSPPLRILVVDDEALIRWSLVQTLGDSGHDAVEAVDGAMADSRPLGGVAAFRRRVCSISGCRIRTT